MEHNNKCKLAFGRPTKEVGACPRCDELRNGAKPRSWKMSYNYQMKHGVGPEYTKWKAALDSHDCKASNCGYVCTAFEW